MRKQPALPQMKNVHLNISKAVLLKKQNMEMISDIQGNYSNCTFLSKSAVKIAVLSIDFMINFHSFTAAFRLLFSFSVLIKHLFYQFLIGHNICSLLVLQGKRKHMLRNPIM